jgi:hypothetical protein
MLTFASISNDQHPYNFSKGADLLQHEIDGHHEVVVHGREVQPIIFSAGTCTLHMKSAKKCIFVTATCIGQKHRHMLTCGGIFQPSKKGQQTLTSDLIYFFRSDFSRHMTHEGWMDNSETGPIPWGIFLEPSSHSLLLDVLPVDFCSSKREILFGGFRLAFGEAFCRAYKWIMAS